METNETEVLEDVDGDGHETYVNYALVMKVRLGKVPRIKRLVLSVPDTVIRYQKMSAGFLYIVEDRPERLDRES